MNNNFDFSGNIGLVEKIEKIENNSFLFFDIVNHPCNYIYQELLNFTRDDIAYDIVFKNCLGLNEISFLYSIFVSDKNVRCGIGTKFINYFIDESTNRNIKNIFLICDKTINQHKNINNFLFFKKNGFISLYENENFSFMKYKNHL